MNLCLRYVRDPAFRARVDAEVAADRARINAHFDAVRRAQQERAWAKDATEARR